MSLAAIPPSGDREIHLHSTWTTRKPLLPEEERAFSDLNAVFGLEGKRVSGGSHSDVIQVAIRDRVYYVKRYSGGRKHRWRGFRRSPPDAERRNLSFFQRLRIPVPSVVAVGSERHHARFVRGALVTEEVPQAETLRMRLFGKTGPTPTSPPSQLLEKLASYVRRMHSLGFVHRDLKLRNILVRQQAGDEVYFLDCPIGRVLPWVARRHYVVRELAGLDWRARHVLSRSSRLRFLRTYPGVSKLRRKDRSLVRSILRREAKRTNGASR
jgi:hypothetical protein